MMLTDGQKARICEAARSYLGTPWRGQGRDHQGIDCIGIVVMALRGGGLEVDEGDPDYQSIDSRRMVNTMLRYCDKLAPGVLPMVADIIVHGQPREAHCGILVNGNPLNAIHCPMHSKVVEARFDPNRGYIRGVYRWR